MRIFPLLKGVWKIEYYNGRGTYAEWILRCFSQSAVLYSFALLARHLLVPRSPIRTDPHAIRAPPHLGLDSPPQFWESFSGRGKTYIQTSHLKLSSPFWMIPPPLPPSPLTRGVNTQIVSDSPDRAQLLHKRIALLFISFGIALISTRIWWWQTVAESDSRSYTAPALLPVPIDTTTRCRINPAAAEFWGLCCSVLWSHTPLSLIICKQNLPWLRGTLQPLTLFGRISNT